MTTFHRSLVRASVAALLALTNLISAQLPAAPDPAAAAKGDPAGKAPQKLQKDTVIEIEAAFFEVPELEANKLGLTPLSHSPEAQDGDDKKNAAKVRKGAASVTTILEPAEANSLMQAARKAPGFKLLAAPRLASKSGQRAVLEIIREFRYVTEFQFDKATNIVTPTAFETRNLGVTLEAEPKALQENLIDLELVPQVVTLEGYIRPTDGQPVPLRDNRSVGADMTLKNLAVPKGPPDMMMQPIFSTRKVTANTTLFSGQSILLGGMRRDTHEDGKPPATSFLYVLVTARRVDRPAAAPDVLPVAFLNKTDEEGFVRSPYAPEASAIDVRGLPAGTELKCPVTKKLFRLP